MSYRWPGNVRELRNVLDRAVVRLGGGRELNAAMLGLQPPDDDHFSEQFLDAKEQVVTRWERDYLGALLRRTDGNVARAARESGLHRPYLHRLLKKHGLVSRRRPPRE
jgi:transcriptional regulator of acetoin/glycerol metabolism